MLRFLSSLATAIAFSWFIISCASLGPTRPNIRIFDKEYTSQTDTNIAEAQRILNEIGSQNQLLALELGKLPELQDGVDQDDLVALRVIQSVYQEHPTSFDAAFTEMYKVGKPGVRRYCSPLQAVYWLAEDGYLEHNSRTIRNYSLYELLDLTWSTGTSLSGKSCLKIIHGYRDESYKAEMIQALEEASPKEIQGYVFQAYQHDPEKFTTEARALIEQEIRNLYSNARWTEFEMVTRRLNAPELVDWYTQHIINYEMRMYIGDEKTNEQVFQTGKANCMDESQFISYLLKRSGYPSGVIWVRSQSPEGHGIAYYKVDSEIYIMDNGTVYRSHWGIQGPFRSFDEIPYRVIEVDHKPQQRWGV